MARTRDEVRQEQREQRARGQRGQRTVDEAVRWKRIGLWPIPPDMRELPIDEAERQHAEREAAAKAEQRRQREERDAKAKSGRGMKANGADAGAIFIRTGDRFAKEYEPLEYVIDEILPKGVLITVTGPGNIGKTALGMMIGAHKANGRALNGREVAQGHVLYASAENTEDFRHRYIAMRDNWPGFAEDHFHVMTSSEKDGLTRNAEAIEAYATTLGIAFDLIIVDTQAAWSPVEDEANNAEQLRYARALRRLCGLPGRPAVLVLSHPVKTPIKAADCRPRGGVAFENETDGNWTLWLVAELVEVAFTRLRVPRWEAFSIRMREIETHSVFDIKGRPLRSVCAEIVAESERAQLAENDQADRDRIVEAMFTATSFSSQRSIGEGAGLVMPGAGRNKDLRRIQRLIADLRRDKLVDGHNRHYRLSKTGRAYAREFLRCGEEPWEH